MRIGFGYDSHRLMAGRRLVLGGVEILHEKGLDGHSDADVLLHALCDALLGAMGENDIGRHFPDWDESYRGISSMVLLSAVKDLMDKNGYRVHNVDSTVIAEEPRLVAFTGEMRKNIAERLSCSPEAINVKATTNEGMGFIGRKEGIAAVSVVTIAEIPR